MKTTDEQMQSIYRVAVEIEKQGIKNIAAALSRRLVELDLYNARIAYKSLMSLRQARINSQYVERKTITSATARHNYKMILRKKHMRTILRALPGTGYSMGDFSTLRVGHTSISIDKTTSYSGKWQGSEKHGCLDLRLSIADYTHINVVGGMATQLNGIVDTYKGIIIRRVDTLVRVGSKQTAELIWKSGYLVGDRHCDTNDGAHSIARAMLQNKIDEQRDQQREAKIKAMTFRALRASYTFPDSLAAGNCEVGTRGFCQKANIPEASTLTGVEIIRKAREQGVEKFALKVLEYRALQISV
jgi:hypothetical protein